MNGSRSSSQRPGSPSSLDALSRTIEGLEARIEGLMNQSGARTAAAEAPARPLPRSRPEEAPRRTDPLAEIRQRQKALEESRNRAADDGSLYRRESVQPARAPMRTPPLSEPRPAFSTRSERRDSAPVRPPAPASRDTGVARNEPRQDFNQDLTEALSREIAGLRSEMRAIRAMAEEHRPQDDLRSDLARLAESIQNLDGARTPGSDGLRQDFDALRSLMDGLAREETVQRMEQRWSDVEVRLDELDTSAMRDEIIRLADRLDDVKAQLGNMGDSRTIRALEDKLMTVAGALEHIGAHIDPSERMVMEQFAGLDLRLDEITRAIAASSRATGAASDPAAIHRLEDRLVGLSRQIETLFERREPEADVSRELAERLELLTDRIEQLSAEQGAVRLEERLDQLSFMLERGQAPIPAPELTGYLADISRKIDALDSAAVNDRLADRLEILARRMEDLDTTAHTAAVIDDSALRNLEDRLNAVVDRLEETSATVPGGESASLRGLEEQIAHLSALISQPSTDPDVTGRISALEDYVATSDEYIIEAARQAAESVMANFSQRNLLGGTAQPADLSALTALSDHLKQLEDYSRHSEERTHRTFEALHDTLVQIAGRLDELHESSQRQDAPAMFAQAPIATAQPARRAEAPAPAASIKPPEMPAPASTHPIDEELLAAADDFAQTMTAMPVIDAARDKKAAKPSLLAGLGKKLMPGKKAAKTTGSANTEARQLVEPAPSLDPVDVLPPDEANELLEPGSGAPDVRKILERVRASQQASKSTGAEADGGDRTDYIAAARRAAQAAAMEMNKTQKAAPSGKTSAKSSAKDGATAKGSAGAGQASLFARYRRPILMAVGAILLAAMAMPLVNTLTRSEAPAIVEESAPEENTLMTPVAPTSTDSASEAAPAAGIDQPVAEGEAAVADSSEAPLQAQAPADAEPTLAPPPAAPVTISAATPASAPVKALMAPVEAGPTPTLDNSAAPAAAATPAAAAEPSVAAPAAQQTAAAEIVVPAEITPPSLSIAAKNGDPLALFEIGARYTEGRGVANNFAEAAKWYKLSADKGFALAQYRLANFLEKGTGLAPDIKEAKRYYEMAAAAGNASAMHNLAVIYASGKDGAQDYAKAVEWFGKAAEHGVSDSQFNLAILYARGNGAAPDLVQSYKWFAVAAKGGDKDAAQKRDEVANAMKPDQLERARAEVDLWKATPLDPDANSANTPDEWAGKGLKTASIDMKKAIRNIQAILNKNGFDAGAPDGVMGAKTVTAIKAFQTSIGEEPTGQVSDKLVKELLSRNK
jgi:localization factor PodJL